MGMGLPRYHEINEESVSIVMVTHTAKGRRRPCLPLLLPARINPTAFYSSPWTNVWGFNQKQAGRHCARKKVVND